MGGFGGGILKEHFGRDTLGGLGTTPSRIHLSHLIGPDNNHLDDQMPVAATLST